MINSIILLLMILLVVYSLLFKLYKKIGLDKKIINILIYVNIFVSILALVLFIISIKKKNTENQARWLNMGDNTPKRKQEIQSIVETQRGKVKNLESKLKQYETINISCINTPPTTDIAKTKCDDNNLYFNRTKNELTLQKELLLMYENQLNSYN